MKTVVWADLHIDHPPAARQRGFVGVPDFQEAVCEAWIKEVHPRGTIILVGDVALYMSGLSVIKKLPGKKILVMGNHDKERDGIITRDLMEVYDELEGLWKHRSGIYFSHSPMHVSQLRNRINVHGHSHRDIIPDSRYVNVCWDLLPNGPINLEAITSGEYRSYRKTETGFTIPPNGKITNVQ